MIHTTVLLQKQNKHADVKKRQLTVINGRHKEKVLIINNVHYQDPK